MRFLLELSGEHPTLPAAEALAALEVQGPVREDARDGTLLAAEGAGDATWMGHRLGLAHAISEPLARVPAEPKAILDAVAQHAARVGPVFRVRAHRVGEHGRGLRPSALERDAGALLAEGRRVDMDGPADEVRLLLAEEAWVALLRARIDRTLFDARHVKRRPFFSPVSLHPRFARAMVNLARIKEGDRVADPFAGTGGVLVEAGLVGAKVVGADADADMAAGARGVLEHYGIAGEVLVGDVAASLARAGPFDAIVTDPPYGRSSSTLQEPPAKLYARALPAIRDALRPGGRAVVVLPTSDVPLPPGLELEQRHTQRVHRSLDRHYCVLRRA
ncbi:MAG TPA: hypothetical protein VGR28_07260 [Candidatus Thermoplasmatota archaeon]|nr:hypothetical protein [Candidatus Thermoplasmatota archaeon]